MNHSILPLNISLDTESFDEIKTLCENFILPQKHRIRSLRLTNQLTIKFFFRFIYLDESFTQLQFVDLNHVSWEDIPLVLSILEMLPRLDHLTLKVLLGPRTVILSSAIYRTLLRFVNLKELNVHLVQNSSSLHNTNEVGEIFLELPHPLNSQNTKIEYLKINHAIQIDDLISIAQHVPKLRFLTVGNINSSRNIPDSSSYNQQSFLFSNVTHLTISNPLQNSYSFIHLLKLVHLSLAYLKLEVKDISNAGLNDTFRELINEKLNNLKWLRISFTHRRHQGRLRRDKLKNLFEFLFHKFWRKNHWKINNRLFDTKVDCVFQRERYST